MEKIAFTLIFLHACNGGVALISGLFALAGKKGTKIHKTWGKVFVISMLLSISTSLIIAVLPNHQNSFLFAVGIFSAYFLISGFRAIRFKTNINNLKIDKAIAIITLISGVLTIGMAFSQANRINIVLVVLGGLGLSFASKDLMHFKNPQTLRKKWLKMHIGKIVGSYISALTAFIVVNQFIPGIWGWFIPGILGTVFIIFWMRKIKKTKFEE